MDDFLQPVGRLCCLSIWLSTIEIIKHITLQNIVTFTKKFKTTKLNYLQILSMIIIATLLTTRVGIFEIRENCPYTVGRCLSRTQVVVINSIVMMYGDLCRSGTKMARIRGRRYFPQESLVYINWSHLIPLIKPLMLNF